MLRKLMKYECKATGRIMLPLYLILFAAALALSVNIRLSTDVSSTNHMILSTILILLFVLSILLVAVVSSVLILLRFYKNLLGDEGYLMFSLPVSTLQNILSKGLTALIWIITSVLTGGICGLVMISIVGDFSEFGTDLKNVWTIYQTYYGRSRAVLFLVLLVITMIFSILEAILKIYASISVGHQWSSHKLVGSILAYMGFSAIEMILSFLMNKTGLSRIIMMSEAPVNSAVSSQLPAELPFLLPILLIALFGLIVYGLITWLLLDKKLNLA